MKKTIYFLLFFLLGCGYQVDGDIIESCPPENYEILYNGEQYAVEIWGIYIFDLRYDTVEEAVEFAIQHHEKLQEYESDYDQWEIVNIQACQ